MVFSHLRYRQPSYDSPDDVDRQKNAKAGVILMIRHDVDGRTQGGCAWSSVTQDAGGLMFLLSNSGATTVFRPNKENLDVVATNSLGESTNASVVIAGSDILIPTDKALWSIGD